MTVRQHLRAATRKYRRRASNTRLRWLLHWKACLRRWDDRMCGYFNVPVPHDPWVRRFIMRGYARGLVPTATTNGVHAPNSFHYQGKAADMGVRTPEVGTRRALRKLKRFQRSEYRRWRRGVSHATELIGPIDSLVVLRGAHSPLAHGSALEVQHRNHCHGAKA